MTEHLLVVLTGPVGGGKTTTALALATRFRALGLPAATIDLDELYLMARQRDGFDDELVWGVARRGAAALADVFFSTGVSAVVVEGGFFTHDERSGLVDCLATRARLVAVTLQVSFDQALERVQADPDPGRVVSRDPAVLRWLHNQYVEALPYLTATSLMVDAGSVPADEVADRIAESVLADVRAG